MDDNLTLNHQPSIFKRLFSAFVPMLLVAVTYVDPGKWAAVVEGGARFKCDIVLLMLGFNFTAILCQYLSARIAVVTEKDLAQICSEEYDKVTCIVLGVQSEISLIVLDLTMILGAVHGLNLIFGLDLLTCIILTAVDAIIFPVLSTLEERKSKFLCICMGNFILFSYVFGVLSSQSGIPLSMGGMLTKLNGESAPALMSVLGASIMPHNFYLHSSIVKQEPVGTSISKETRCHDHLFAILCIFSGIFLVNYVLVNSAANVFYSTDLLLTFQDALSLMDQVFRNLVLPIALILILIFSNHITALTWKLGRQAVLHNFFGMAIPGCLHHATIRVIAIVPALYCVWNSGAEGIYQMLICTQILIALLLPSSVIPLFRVATSRSVMGAYKISQSLEFLFLVVFVGILGLEIVFVIEMIFGNSDWVSNLRWNLGGGMSVLYVVLLITAFVSLCLILWLAATPLTSASSRLDAQTCNRDIQASMPGSLTENNQNDDFNETVYHGDECNQKLEPTLSSDEGSHLDMSTLTLNLPETLLDSDYRPPLTTVEGICSGITYSSPSVCHPTDSATMVEIVPGSTVSKKFSHGETVDATTLATEPSDLVVMEGDSQTEKDDEGDTWEPEISSKAGSETSPFVTSEGPGSYRSLSGKGDDVGSGAGSLSRLAGLGRAARRQLAVVLDEFWGQLFDFHGQATQEAKTRKLDAMLGLDSKVDPKTACASPKLENSRKEFTGNVPSAVGKVPDSLINSSLFDSPRQQRGQSNVESCYGVQRESSFWSNNTQLLDTYMQNSNGNATDSGERRYSSLQLPPSDSGERHYSSLRLPPSDSGQRRYSSLRLPPSADVCDNQPATIHGYQIAHLSRIAKEIGSGSFTGQMESLAPKSSSVVSSIYRDPFAIASGQRLRNGLSAKTPPGFPSLAVSRNSSLQPGGPLYGISSAGPTDNVGISVNTKKYHSSPDISGLSLTHRNSLLSDKGAPWDSPTIYQPSVGRTMYDASLYQNVLSKAYLSPSSKGGAPLVFDEFSSSKVCREAFQLQLNSSTHSSLDTGSLWSRQPFEQFGVADKASSIEGEGVRSMQSSITQETESVVDFEAKLLQSFRICIQKLLKLEGSDWLFRQNDGADEDLVDSVAARERFFYEAENQMGYMGESHFSVEKKPGFPLKNEEMVTSVPHCGEGCIWRVDLIISFGVWCIHRILELSLEESRPELWGKYTYVLNRLQGIIELAFSRPRSPSTPCFCLQIPVTHQQWPSPPNNSNGSLSPPAKHTRGKCTTAAMLLDMVKDVEIAISGRKGRAGTAAGDVAFPKGKENLASVLKRYKRRLTSKPVGSRDSRPQSR